MDNLIRELAREVGVTDLSPADMRSVKQALAQAHVADVMDGRYAESPNADGKTQRGRAPSNAGS